MAKSTKSEAKKKTANNNKSAAKNNTEKKGSKKHLTILLVVAVILGFVGVAVNFGDLAKSAVEKVASKSMGVPVRLESLEISLKDKSIEVTGLTVGNPRGYEGPYALSVQTINIAAKDISKELLVFSDIKVTGTTVNLELNEKGNNLSDLRKSAKAAKTDKPKSAAEKTKVIINRLDIENAMLNSKTTLVESDLQSIKMPPIRITGIGEKSNGVLVSEAIVQVLNYVTQVATKRALQSGFMQGMNSEMLKELGNEYGFTIQSGQQGGIVDKVKGLFGN